MYARVNKKDLMEILLGLYSDVHLNRNAKVLIFSRKMLEGREFCDNLRFYVENPSNSVSKLKI